MDKGKRELTVWAVCMAMGGATLLAQSVVTVPADAAESAPRLSAPPASLSPAPSTTILPAAPTSVDTRMVGALLVNSIVAIESSGNPRMVGRHGERGLMQIKSGTWGDMTESLYGKRLSFNRAFEPRLNREVGAAYLAYLQNFLAKHRSHWKADERSLLLACYNAGPERVKRAGFDVRRLPASTRDYIQRGSALHDSYMADHNLDVKQIRLAMDTALRPIRGS